MHAEAVAFGVPSAPRECSATTRATMWEEQIGPHKSWDVYLYLTSTERLSTNGRWD